MASLSLEIICTIHCPDYLPGLFKTWRTARFVDVMSIFEFEDMLLFTHFSAAATA